MATRKTSRKKPTARKKTTARKKSTARSKVTARKKPAARHKPPAQQQTSGTANETASGGGTSTQQTSGAGRAGIRVRMYRVGFGDFFLVTLTAASGPLHILIDCGVHAANLGSIGAAIDQLKAETNGKLALIIMTHRHADHISGFGSGAAVFKTFEVERIWMSWFENPNDPVAANFQAGLVAVANRLQLALTTTSAADHPDADMYLQMALNVTGTAENGGGNTAALQTLHHGFANSPPIDYYQAGQTATLPASLAKAGLTAQILGPPHDKTLVVQMDNKNDQYLTGTADIEDEPPARLSQKYAGSADDYGKAAFALFSPDKIEKLVTAQQPQLHFAMTQNTDNTLNNQSLVVLFTFKGKTLLFPGDAQWGNWDNWAFGAVALATNPHITSTGKAILGKVDFYKVGHHGSTNANPIDAIQSLPQGCTAMCSTQPTAYGKPSTGTEVPRGPLIDALVKKTNGRIALSDTVPLSAAETTTKAEVPPWTAQTVKGESWPAPPPRPAIFTTGPNGTLYIDYEL